MTAQSCAKHGLQSPGQGPSMMKTTLSCRTVAYVSTRLTGCTRRSATPCQPNHKSHAAYGKQYTSSQEVRSQEAKPHPYKTSDKRRSPSNWASCGCCKASAVLLMSHHNHPAGTPSGLGFRHLCKGTSVQQESVKLRG